MCTYSTESDARPTRRQVIAENDIEEIMREFRRVQAFLIGYAAACFLAAIATFVALLVIIAPRYADVTVAPPTSTGAFLADRVVFFKVEGSGHIEPKSNCCVARGGQAIAVPNNYHEVIVKLVADEPWTVSKAFQKGGFAIRRGNELTVHSIDVTACYTARFTSHVVQDSVIGFKEAPRTALLETPGLCTLQSEPPRQPEEKGEPSPPAQDQAPAAEQAQAEEVTEVYDPEAPRFVWEGVDSHYAFDDNILTRWYAELGYKWYLAHSYTDYGRSIASLQVGDRVCVDGNTVTIEGMIRAYPGNNSADALKAVGGTGKTIFQTCADDGTGQVLLFYGE